MRSAPALLLLFSGLVSSAAIAAAQDTIAPELLAHIPSPYREEFVALHPKLSEADQQAALRIAAANPDAALAYALKYLGQQPQEFDFLLNQLTRDTDASHRLLILTQSLRGQIRSLDDAARPLHSPAAVQSASTNPPSRLATLETALTRVASNDPDAGVALEAARDLRKIRWGQNGRLVLAAASSAHTRGDVAGEAALRKEADDWLAYDEQVNLPTFLRTPPPVFSVVAEDKPIRVLAFGDFGTGSPAQSHLAQTMLAYGKQHPLDFGITLGDNFYPRGVASPDDPHWARDWEKPYGPLGLHFYPVLGNHDYLQPDSPAAEILYTQRSNSWRMPASFYTYTAGPVQFFAIDTEELSDTFLYQRQLAWLDAEIAKSKARWKVVYGHYQIFSATRGDEQNLISRLMPVLRNRVDLYLCGHDHNLQQLKTEDGVHFLVSGGGGAELYDFTQKNYARSVFKAKQNGFTILEADQKSLTLQMVNSEGQTISTETIH
jgi:tartrate-resistant acid phosphatase type 5